MRTRATPDTRLRARIARVLAGGRVPPHLAATARTLLAGYASTPQLERLLERMVSAARRRRAAASEARPPPALSRASARS